MTQKQAVFNLMGGKVLMSQSNYNPTCDAVWLAAAGAAKRKAESGKRKDVLDVGIGNGAVSLCYLVHNPGAIVTGIDISTEMIGECAKNAELNGRNIELLNTDIMTWRTGRTFDLVITNPPYFRGTPRKGTGHRALLGTGGVHHNVDLTQWTKQCLKRVRPRGYFCTIIDATAMAEVIAAMHPTCGDITIFPLFGAKNTAERVIIRGRLGVKSGTCLFSGVSMNDDRVLRDGLTIDAIFTNL